MAEFITRLKPRSQSAGDDLPLWMAADSTQKQKPKGDGEGDAEAKDGEGGKKLAKKGEELKEEMDSLMDEIDSVLEENAEELLTTSLLLFQRVGLDLEPRAEEGFELEEAIRIGLSYLPS